jgi:hypothetical protein
MEYLRCFIDLAVRLVCVFALLSSKVWAQAQPLTAELAAYCYATTSIKLQESRASIEARARDNKDVMGSRLGAGLAAAHKLELELLEIQKQRVAYFLGAADATRPGFLSTSEARSSFALARSDTQEMENPSGTVTRCSRSCLSESPSNREREQRCLVECVGNNAAFSRVRACSSIFPYVTRKIP